MKPQIQVRRISLDRVLVLRNDGRYWEEFTPGMAVRFGIADAIGRTRDGMYLSDGGDTFKISIEDLELEAVYDIFLDGSYSKQA